MNIKVTTRKSWSESECIQLIELYSVMYAHQLASEAYSKAALVRGLMADIERTKGSIEAKLMNVSGVLNASGHAYVTGYKPLSNAQKMLADIVKQQFSIEG